MFKTVKRIIDWCGEFKGKLYLGFVMTFFSHIFAALPLALAAYTVGLLIESQPGGAAFDAAWIWKTIVIQIVLVLLRFLFDYLRARLQEAHQLPAHSARPPCRRRCAQARVSRLLPDNEHRQYLEFHHDGPFNA